MARSRSDSPALFEAVRVNEGELSELPEDADSENAWDGWINDLRKANGAGVIRVAKLPVDEKGLPLPNAKGQVNLGAWPHDQYDFDGLLAHIRANFMKPGETCHVRISGHEAGKPGVRVNQIVSLQRPAAASPVETANSQLGEILTAMREDRVATQNLLKEFIDKPTAPAPASPLANPFWGELAKIGLPIAGTIISALITRPAKPSSDIAGLIEIAKLLKDGASGDDDKDGNSTLDIIKAVAPKGLELLNTLAQNASAKPVAPPARQLAAPVARTAMPIAQAPVSPAAPAPVTPTTPAPVASIAPAPVSSPSPEDPAVFAAIKPHLEELCTLAERNADPTEVAQLTVQLLPEAVQDQLAELIEHPEKFKLLFVLEPRMKSHAEWFERLRTALESLLFDDAPGAPDTTV